jgi:peroxiredoxin
MKNPRRKLIMLLALVAVPCIFFAATQLWLVRTRGLQPGDALPRAALLDRTGQAIDTESWRGSPTLLVLFRSQCQACESEIANLIRLAPSLPGLRIVLLTVDPDKTGNDLPFQVYRDPTGEFLHKSRRLMVPTLYWVSPEGRIVYARSGRRSLEDDGRIFRQLLVNQKARTTGGRL